MKELEVKILKIFHDYQVTHGGLTLVAKEIAALIEPYKKLVKAQDELITFYGEIIENSAMFLHVHHWEESTENIKKGRNLRDDIEQLKDQLK